MIDGIINNLNNVDISNKNIKTELKIDLIASLFEVATGSKRKRFK